ncbi:cytochrome c [soil metagenome]
MPEPTLEPVQRLPKARLAFIYLAPVLILAYFWAVPFVLEPRLRNVVPTPPAEELSGAQVYTQNCAYCHGVNGDGRGSVILHPPARYFGRDKFKFATTSNAMPTDDDLKAVLNRGIPGSAMPSFAALQESQKDAVIGHLRTLIRKGLYDRQVQKALAEDEDVEHAKFTLNASTQAVPAASLAIPKEFPASTPEAIARGKAFFTSEAWGCSKCHGPEGLGNGPQTKDPKFVNDDKTPAVPRDLTKGVFKGGADPANIFARIRLGIPGSPMPDNKDKPEKDVFDVIAFVLSLSPTKVTVAPPASGATLGSNSPVSGTLP